ncbi:hypothetical protein [Clostridium vincentii]|uniref:Chromosome partition protein Smc n=1 Tax=Clostridium vincentii TaxID=52704 RepID=A0A2T0BIR9_9CLOT|nr:hypothetical protein [Clostridium vincentii]PRR83770.1 hypothetical protein CLVI_07170 [Clostridium vincentii]
MRISDVNIQISNNILRDEKCTKTKANDLGSINLSYKKKETSYISSLINQKQEMQKTLKELEVKRKEHIAELESNLSDVLSEIHGVVDKLSNSNNESDKASELKGGEAEIDKASELKDEEDKIDNVSVLKDEKAEIVKASDIKAEEQLSGKVTVSDNLIADNTEYIELCNLADKYKSELEIYKETSKKEIENLKDKIKDIDKKIAEARGNVSNIINEYA